MEEKEVVTNTNVTENVTAIVKQEEPKPQVSTQMQEFGDNWRIATQLAKSDLIPDHFKGKPENVIIGLQLANQMGIAPFTILQNLSVVRGKASFSGTFCRILIEKTGIYKDIDLVYVGEKGNDDYGCYMQAVRKSDNKIVKGPLVDMKMVKAEGWIKNTKWVTMTDLMLGYRASAFFCRLHCPSALNGMMVEGEAEDIQQTKIVVEDVL